MARPRKATSAPSPEERLLAAVFLDTLETDPEVASLKREKDRQRAAEQAAADAYEASCDVEVTSLHKGGFLHLGDGRKLAFRETAKVTADLAAVLIANGQAK